LVFQHISKALEQLGSSREAFDERVRNKKGG